MKQQNSRMTAELNKLIGNTIVIDGGVYLPSIGSLSVVTTPPSMQGSSKDSSAPQRTVQLLDEERHRALTQIISERGNCTPQQAAIVYKKWLEIISDQQIIELDGVGVIKDKVFTPASSLITKLNPVTERETPTKSAPKEEVKKVKEVKKAEVESKSPESKVAESEKKSQPTKPTAKSSSDKRGSKKGAMPYILGVAVLVVITIVLVSYNRPEVSLIEVVEESTLAEQASQPTQKPEPQKVADTKPQPKSETAKPTTAKPSKAEATLEAALEAGKRNINLPYKVVYGAYSTPENVARAIALATKATNGKVSCTAYRHGKSYIVSIYDSKSKSEASNFIKSHKEIIKEPLWIHKR